MTNLNDPIIVVLDTQAYDYLLNNVPDMLEAIETALASGETPGEIYTKVMVHSTYADPSTFASKCRAAARHIQRISK